MLAAFHPGLGRKVGHLFEGTDVLRAAVRVAAVVKRVDPDKYVAGLERLRPSQRERQKDGVTGGHVGNRDPLAHLAGTATLRHRHVRGQRRPAEHPQVGLGDLVLGGAERLGHPASCFQLDLVSLPVSEAQGAGSESLGSGDRQCCCGVEAAAEQHYRPRFLCHQATSKSSTTGPARPTGTTYSTSSAPPQFSPSLSITRITIM